MKHFKDCNKKRILALALLSTSAFSAMAQPKLSGEVLMGEAKQTSTIDNFVALESDSTTFGARLGYNVNSNFSFEVGYQHYGRVEDAYLDEFDDTITDKMTPTAFNAGIKVAIPFNNGFSINGRLGVAYWDNEIKQTDSSAPNDMYIYNESGKDMYYGFGINYQLTKGMSAGLEYQTLTMESMVDDYQSAHKIETLALTLGYAF